MKKITSILTIASLLIINAVSAAETVTQKDIIGTWTVTGESHGKDKKPKKVNNTWDFDAAGVLHTISKDIRTDTLTYSTTYKVENGLLLKEIMGRSGKYDRCKIDLKDKEMVLECGNMYYFLTKTK